MQWIEPDWPAPANIHAVTTLRNGGYSRIPFDSLNPAAHVGDDAEHVWQNRQLIRETLGLPAEPDWLNQVHGVKAVSAQKNRTEQAVTADASYTDQAGVVCAILTADCLPILLTDKQGKTIAAIHAGWRGLLAGVIDKTLEQLPQRSYMAWLGPAIGPDCFEVGIEAAEAFVQHDSQFQAAFCQITNNKFLADIYHLARLCLAQRGIEQVYGGGRCTVCEPEYFFSYRRDGRTGRMATLIWRE
jgi:YfiH family protein